jgi:hypothetical protein
VDFGVTLQIAKADRKSRTITGWAAVVTRDDGSQVIDSDDHVLPVEVLKRGVQDAFAEGGGTGRVDVNHKQDGTENTADLVESFVVTKANRKALGLGDSGREGWIATIRVDDPEIIARIESGELTELSLSGEATGVWV